MVFGVLKLHEDFWFEDDPALYRQGAAASHPFASFLSTKEASDFGTPNEFIPMLRASFWLDAKIAYLSPFVAYVHSGVAFVATALAIFLILRALVGSIPWAFVGTVLWTLLPSTIATVSYLSTRCYMEGLLFSCLALLLMRRHALFAGFFGLLAVFSKEFFPPVLLTSMFLISLHRRDWKPVALSVIVGIIYASVRLALVGPGMSYGMPFLPLERVPALILKLPYYFAGNFGGYAMFAGVVVAVLLGRRTYSAADRRVLALLASTWALGVATTFPVFFALDAFWRENGMWTRTGFVFNTIALAGFVWCLSKAPLRFAGLCGAISALAALSYGGFLTAKTFVVLKSHYRAEGEFVLDGTGRALLSTLPASWYLSPLLQMHPESRNRVALRKEEVCNAVSSGRFAPQWSEIWVYDGHSMAKAPGGITEIVNGCK